MSVLAAADAAAAFGGGAGLGRTHRRTGQQDGKGEQRRTRHQWLLPADSTADEPARSTDYTGRRPFPGSVGQRIVVAGDSLWTSTGVSRSSCPQAEQIQA